MRTTSGVPTTHLVSADGSYRNDVALLGARNEDSNPRSVCILRS